MDGDPGPFAAIRWSSLGAPLMKAARTWTATGSPRAWSVDSIARAPVLILPVTPQPWSFWLGLAQHEARQMLPIVLFKNAIPMFEATTRGLLQTPGLDPGTWEPAVAAWLTRNPGLEGCSSASLRCSRLRKAEWVCIRRVVVRRS
jgi:hypothetical protein